MYFIHPQIADVNRALESWDWLPIQSKVPFSITAFGDVFLESSEGIWFLDSLEGTLTKVAETREELQSILSSEEMQDHYLMAGFVIRANNEGMRLGQNECYEFKIPPVLSGPIEFDNIEVQNFVVALHIRGQIHKQAEELPPGTIISEFKVIE